MNNDTDRQRRSISDPMDPRTHAGTGTSADVYYSYHFLPRYIAEASS